MYLEIKQVMRKHSLLHTNRINDFIRAVWSAHLLFVTKIVKYEYLHKQKFYIFLSYYEHFYIMSDISGR